MATNTEEKKDETKGKQPEGTTEKKDETIIVKHVFEKGKGWENTTGNPANPEKTDPKTDEKKTDLPKTDETKTDEKTGEKKEEIKTDEKKGEEKKDEKKTYSKEEFEAMKARAEEAEEIVNLSAEQEFTRRKNALLEKITDEAKRKEVEDSIGNDPAKLESVELITAMIGEKLKEAGVKITGTEEEKETPETGPIRKDLPPSGTPPAPPEGKTGSDYKDYVDALYDILRDPKTSTRDKDEANKKLDQLFGEMFRAIKEKRHMPFVSVSECPNCGELLGSEATECKVCGWKHRVK